MIPRRRTQFALMLFALVSSTVSAVAREPAKDRGTDPTATPKLIEIDPTSARSEQIEAPCPCFDVQELVSLSAHSWDLCRHDGLLVQVTRWVGEEVPPEGRFGYHILASLPNPRSGNGSCQYFLRDSGDHEVRTLLRRWPSLADGQAETCFEMMERWLDGLGGCASPADPSEVAPPASSGRPDPD